MLVIVVDADPIFRRFVAQSLTSTEFEPKLAAGAPEALVYAEEADSPFIFLYGPVLEGEGGTAELAERVRELRSPRESYTIATFGLGEGRELVAAVEAGIDDVLAKPFSPDALLARLRLAAKRLTSPDRSAGSPRAALDEALASKFGGEVVIRHGDRVGRIHVSNGGVAWAHVAGEPTQLGDLLRGAGLDIDDEAAAAVLEESKRLGGHFSDVLVRWRLVDEAGARACVRTIVTQQLGTLLDLKGATALFLPRGRAYGARMSFPLIEVAAPREPARLPLDCTPSERARAEGDTARLEEYVEGAMRFAGALAVAVLDRRSGAARVSRGAELEGELGWALLGTLAASGPEVVDAIAVRREAAILARVIDEGSALLVAFSLDQTTLGLARSSVHQLVTRQSTSR